MSSPASQMPAYSEAARSGLYAKRSGLVGKYDNVRRYWEDEATRHFLRPHLAEQVRAVRARGHGLRVLDLGCGSADGYELLAGIRPEAPLAGPRPALLAGEALEAYAGADLNEDLLAQARDVYGEDPRLGFRQGDFTRGLPLARDDESFDLYFSSYGTFSHHLDDETSIALLADIARRTREHSLIVCDWLGRHAYEWQELWTNDLHENRVMDYVISYIYPAEEREARRAELAHLQLRLLGREEAEVLVAEASRRAGVKIEVLELFDRSIFTGRHMDTAEYNAHARPIRVAVNSLHEPHVRTDLCRLVFEYVPKAGFDALNEYFTGLETAWNALVEATEALLCGERPSLPERAPEPLRDAVASMQRLVAACDGGDARENIIEPQLGYALRDMMARLQRGLGAAHGLCAILQVRRSRKTEEVD